ncbi:hypothetical protein EDB80DRAFT_805935 [Ilyonectria destructans]|nr:hypothetical protein EDB80DRAFT_805935 [Ilyonectria destructans]
MSLFKDVDILTRMKAATLAQGQFREVQNLQKAQNPDCPFLQLPVELLLMIVEMLPDHDIMIVLQTCRPLRFAVDRLRPSVQDLTREDSLEFLVSIARELPDRWVCERCVKLHRLRKFDNSKRVTRSTCRRAPLSEEYYPMNYERRLCHHHVQLALKYARMENIQRKYRKYLEAVLSPSHMKCLSNDADLGYHQSYYPKVVGGRFLMLGVLHYDRNRVEVSARSIGYLTVCSHQNFIFSDLARLEALRALEPTPPPDPSLALSRTMLAGFEAGGVEVHGSCSSCPTDFAFHATPEHATLHFWQDLGPEGSPLNPNWRINVLTIRIPTERLKVDHEEGSIRSLYESDS